MAHQNDPHDNLDATIYGWEPGKYKRRQGRQETILKILVFTIAMLLLCGALCAAVGAYYFI
jgi:hypothetical protein